MNINMGEHKPRRGDKFWDEARKPEQPNGRIIMVDWEEKEVTVEFMNDDKTWGHYTFSDIEDYYDGTFMGGGYYIYDRVSKLI